MGKLLLAANLVEVHPVGRCNIDVVASCATNVRTLLFTKTHMRTEHKQNWQRRKQHSMLQSLNALPLAVTTIGGFTSGLTWKLQNARCTVQHTLERDGNTRCCKFVLQPATNVTTNLLLIGRLQNSIPFESLISVPKLFDTHIKTIHEGIIINYLTINFL